MMANLKHIQIDEDDHLISYYITLCHVYYFNDSDNNTEVEKSSVDATIETISNLIFHAINIEGTTFREMDQGKYESEYKRFYNDIMDAIKECCKNTVDFDYFLEIIDEIVGAAVNLASAFEKLKNMKEEANDDEETAIEEEEERSEEEE